MYVLIVLSLIIGPIVWYAMRGRDWLKAKPWAQGFFARVEPIETFLYKKSETMLVGRMMWLGSAIVTLNDFVAVMAPSLDWTPITSRVLAPVPEDLRGIVVSASLGGIGLLIGWLRKRTAKPIELVAAPTTPETIEAEAKVETANAEAVATVAEVAKVS